MGITGDLVRYLAETNLAGIPLPVRQRAKELILDTLGVAVAGTTVPAAKLVREHVRRTGGRGHSIILGTRRRTSAAMAAFANGVAAAALDYDDTSFLMIAHTSGSMVPALLALGEELGASGRDLLEAYILGHEVGAKVARGVIPQQYLQGWHATGTMGTICSTAACARLAKLDPERAAHALGIGSSLASGLRGNFGSHTKALHSGQAARNAITAVSLARDGFTANPDIFDHHYGFVAATAGKHEPDFSAIQAAIRDTRTFALLDPGVGAKLYPCNSAVLPGIQSTLELVREHDIRPEQVEVIEYGYTPLARTIVPFDDPKSSPEAMYSMTHAIAVAVVDRQAGIVQFAEERVHDPRVAAMRATVRPYEHPELRNVSDPHDIPASYVTIRLKDGRSFTRHRQRPKAYPGGEPVTREELLEKFTACMGLVLPSRRAQRCRRLIEALEDVPAVSQIARVLAAG